MGSFSTVVLGICFIAFILTHHIPQANADDPGKYQDFLDAHNKIRAEVGVGPLEWSSKLEAYAQKYADSKKKTCEMEHSMGPYGESLAEGYGEMTGEEAVNFWATEKSEYDPATNKCTGSDPEGCMHYTQVIWSKTTHVGCAKSKCANGWVFVICDYDPSGNMEGERPY